LLLDEALEKEMQEKEMQEKEDAKMRKLAEQKKSCCTVL
jgi:hypothetical protein